MTWKSACLYPYRTCVLHLVLPTTLHLRNLLHVLSARFTSASIRCHLPSNSPSTSTSIMIPSAVLFTLCLFFIAVVTLLLQRRYLPLRSTPEYLLVSTFLGLFLSSSIIVLVPIDLASSSSTDDGSRGIPWPSLQTQP